MSFCAKGRWPAHYAVAAIETHFDVAAISEGRAIEIRLPETGKTSDAKDLRPQTKRRLRSSLIVRTL